MKTEQIKNAIKWIDALASGDYKQAPWGAREALGDQEDGFCCLGVGCEVLGVDYEPSDGWDGEFRYIVGLGDNEGTFNSCGLYFYGKNSLISINDRTKAGFKRISKLLKNHPDWVFIPEVAEGISNHYGVRS